MTDFNSTLDTLFDDEPVSSFEDAIEELKTLGDSIPSPTVLMGLSYIKDSNQAIFVDVWNKMDVPSRQILLQMLVDVNETHYEFDYEFIGRIALNDTSSTVRRSAIELLSDYETGSLVTVLLKRLDIEQDIDVVAEIIRAFGRYIQKGEVNEFSQSHMQQACEYVDQLLKDENLDIRLKAPAIEALAHSHLYEMTPFIKQAYTQDTYPTLKLSAIVAMGNTCDEQWNAIILRELENDDVDIRIAATRATGMLELREAIPLIKQMLVEPNREQQEIAIEVLGEIGGDEALEILTAAAEIAEDHEDEEMLELINDAVTNISFGLGDLPFPDLDEF